MECAWYGEMDRQNGVPSSMNWRAYRFRVSVLEAETVASFGDVIASTDFWE